MDMKREIGTGLLEGKKNDPKEKVDSQQASDR